MREFIAPLECYPGRTCEPVNSIAFQADIDAVSLSFEFLVRGDIGAVRWPAAGEAERKDGLWKTTCFEVFLTMDTPGSYAEFNFSPSGDWAAYAFSGYREGMTPLRCASPDIEVHRASSATRISIRLNEFDSAILTSDGKLAASAVIEDGSGTLHYWALAHPGPKPDFHHPDSFILGPI